jgi:DNA-binding response OmpR family regulator
MALRVMIVEDELQLADILEEVLLSYGFEIAGIAGTVNEGRTIVTRGRAPDVAVIDIRLAEGDDGTCLGRDLIALGKIGVLYASGNIDPDFFARAIGHAYIAKPYALRDMCRAVEITAERARTGQISGFVPNALVLLPLPL